MGHHLCGKSLSFRALVALQKQAPLLLMPVLRRSGNKPASQQQAEPAEQSLTISVQIRSPNWLTAQTLLLGQGYKQN